MACNEHKNLCGITRRAHLHLKYLCDKVLQDDKFIPLDDATEETETGILVKLVHRKVRKLLKSFYWHL